MAVAPWVTGVAVVLNGLLAGLFAAFAVAVMPGLAAGPDAVIVTAMRQVNRAIVTTVFLVVFLGAPATAIAVAVVRPSLFSLGAAVLALVTLGITVVVNVPLNDALDAAPARTAAEVATARAAFESAWTRANVLRTVTAVAALACLSATRGST